MSKVIGSCAVDQAESRIMNFSGTVHIIQKACVENEMSSEIIGLAEHEFAKEAAARYFYTSCAFFASGLSESKTI